MSIEDYIEKVLRVSLMDFFFIPKISGHEAIWFATWGVCVCVHPPSPQCKCCSSLGLGVSHEESRDRQKSLEFQPFRIKSRLVGYPEGDAESEHWRYVSWFPWVVRFLLIKLTGWYVFCDEPSWKWPRWPFSSLNNEQISNWLVVEHYSLHNLQNMKSGIHIILQKAYDDFFTFYL